MVRQLATNGSNVSKSKNIVDSMLVFKPKETASARLAVFLSRYYGMAHHSLT